MLDDASLPLDDGVFTFSISGTSASLSISTDQRSKVGTFLFLVKEISDANGADMFQTTLNVTLEDFCLGA